MTLLSSFSLSYFARPAEQSGYADVMLRYFSAAYTPVPIAGTGAEVTLLRSFSLTIPEIAVIEAQRDPFGLITHKKK